MSNELKRFLRLFLYTIFVIIVYFIGERYLLYLRRLWSSPFSSDLYMIFLTIFPIIIGLIISLPRFVNEMQKKGKWKIDWIKFFAIGIPVLYITIFPLVRVLSYYIGGSNLPLLNALYRSPITIYLPVKNSGVVLGYLLLTLPYKQPSNESEIVIENATDKSDKNFND